jgi:hypothetical protein
MIILSRSGFASALFLSSAALIRDDSTIFSIIPHTNSRRLKERAQYVRTEVANIIQRDDSTLAGSILRLAFHDATIRSNAANPWEDGADGSIQYEMDWPGNRGLSKPLKVVQSIYEAQPRFAEHDGDFILSFADVVALCGAAAVETANGPHIPIQLGRSDANVPDREYLTASIVGESDRSTISTSLPSPALDSLGLQMYFGRLGLTQEEWVALNGSHDMGRHITLTGMPKSCLKNLTRSCLEDAPISVPFVTPSETSTRSNDSKFIVDTLSNDYYKKLIKWYDRKVTLGEVAFIPTDVALVVDDKLRRTVQQFARSEGKFFRSFVTGYQKLVESTATTTSRY